jgi:hypothetical protein
MGCVPAKTTRPTKKAVTLMGIIFIFIAMFPIEAS